MKVGDRVVVNNKYPNEKLLSLLWIEDERSK